MAMEGEYALDKVKSGHSVADRGEQSVSVGREAHRASLVDNSAQIGKLETMDQTER
jgi:hypothetical protein